MLHVEITRENTNKGVRKSFTQDALAMAIRDAVTKKYKLKPKSFQVIIPTLDVGFVEGYKIDIPLKVQEFIKKSDSTQPLHPMSFDLDMPDDLFDCRDKHQRE